MSRVFSILTLLIAGGAALGQEGVDRPKLYASPPPIAEERDQRESLYRYAYGLLCERDDKLIEALLAYEQSAKLDPRASEPLRAQAPILLMLDRPKDALAMVEAALKLDPDDHMTWFFAARLHKGFGQMKEFRTCVEKVLATPDLAQDDPALAQQLYLDLARYLESSDAPAEAVAPYRSALKILDHPDLLQDHGPLIERQAIVAKAGEIYEKLGDLLTKLKQYDDAVAAYRKSIERRPEQGARLCLHIARIEVEQNRPAEALANLDQYLRLHPGSPEPYKMRLDLLAKLGRQAEGLPWLDQTSQADPLNVNLKLLLASEYAAAGSVAKAEAVYRSLVADTPTEEAYRAYFKLLFESDRTGNQQMLESFDSALRLGTSNARRHQAPAPKEMQRPFEIDRARGRPGAGDARRPARRCSAGPGRGRCRLRAEPIRSAKSRLPHPLLPLCAILASMPHGRLEQAERLLPRPPCSTATPENEPAAL